MTKAEFDQKFHDVKGRAYEWDSRTRAPAPWPAFDAFAVNEKNIEHECRFKSCDIEFNENDQSVDIDWMTQEECDEHSKFDRELIRCFIEMIGVETVNVHLYDRDGYFDFNYSLKG